MSLIKYDEKVARSVHDQLNCIGITENAVFPKEKEKENYRPRTLVDQTLEYIDPTPNVHTLFIQFNEKFFWNVLLPVQVKWSPRMTSCAGVCTFHPRNRECIISLSNPLLKLRPRKDLIETLLHEMIHAYLFLTNDNRDRDGHGPVFQSHMKRINNEAGTNITIYHSFHDEVRLYQNHWWRCNGPCQRRAPYFGTVRRAMNRAPGPSDFWFAEHTAKCGGQFIKIKEPEKPEARKKKNDTKGHASTGKNTSTTPKSPEKNSILNWINKTGNNSKAGRSKPVPKKPNQSQITNWSNNKNTNNVLGKNIPEKTSSQTNIAGLKNTKSNSIKNIQTDLKKLGNTTNNVHGWGTGGPNGTSVGSNNSSFNDKNSTNNKSSSKSTVPLLSFSGTLGGSGTGKSNLLDKFANTATNVSQKSNSSSQSNPRNSNLFKKPKANSSTSIIIQDITVPTVNCPNCSKTVEEQKINEHLDMCLQDTEQSYNTSDNLNKKRKSEDNFSTPNKMFKNDNTASSSQVECPLCTKKILPEKFNDHLDNCLQNDFNEKENDVVSVHDSSSSSVNLHDSPHLCLICDQPLDPGMSLNDHLEDCVASVFDDDHNDSSNDVIEETKTDTKQDLDSYPCPVCMILVKQSSMNEHLDACLTKTK